MVENKNKPRWPKFPLITSAEHDASGLEAVHEAVRVRKDIEYQLELGYFFAIKKIVGNELRVRLVEREEVEKYLKQGFVIHDPDAGLY